MLDITQDIMVERKRGLEKPSVEGNKKEIKVSKLPSLRNTIAALAAMAAFGGVEKNAEADPGTVDDVRFIGSLSSTDPVAGAFNADFSNPGSYGFQLERGINNGGVVELNSNYAVKLQSVNGDVMEIIDVNSGSVVESVPFQESVNISNGIVPIGEGYVMVTTGVKSHVFNISDIGTPSFAVSELSNSVSPKPLYFVMTPNGDKAGVAFDNGLMFSYFTGDLMANPEASNGIADQKINTLLIKLDLYQQNGSLKSGFGLSTAVAPDETIFYGTEYNGDYKQYKMEAVVATPTPVLSVPAEFSLNVVEAGNKALQVQVTDMVENGSIALFVDGVSYDLSDLGGGTYEKVFTVQELLDASKGEITTVANVKVLDADGNVVLDENGAEVSQEIALNIDVVAPAAIDFEIEGAYEENGLNVIDVEEVPTEVVLTWPAGSLDGLAMANVSVASIPMVEGMTVSEFNNMSEAEKVDWIQGNVNVEETPEGEVTFKMGSLGSIKEVDLDATEVGFEAREEAYVIVMISVDAADNINYKVEALEVRLNEVEEPVDMGPDMDPEDNPDMGPDMDPEDNPDMDPDMNPDEMDKDEKPVVDHGNPQGEVTPGGGDDQDPTCNAVPTEKPAAPGAALVATLLGLFGIRRKKK